jgi:16S rRNA (cytosine967-C5)-methyltransferase
MPRRLALDVLDEILIRKKSFELSFDGHPHVSKLEQRDRNLAYRLTATVLRRLGQLDALIETCLERPLPKKAATARNILRMGAAQICFLDTPHHAAVDTSVDLAQTAGQGPYKKLINAILRRLGREGEKLVGSQDAARLNTPDWLWESWSAAYGEETCRRIAEAHLIMPPLDITVKSDPAAWAEKLDGEMVAGGSIRLSDAGAVTGLPGFETGNWWVQDAAAALPVGLLGDVKDKRVADLCAAPGGKTAQLAAAGAHVTAVDRSKPRLAVLEINLARLNLTADCVEADAVVWEAAEPFDAVLIDAPCTSTGTLRRHPDIGWLKSPKDVAGVAGVQGSLLKAAEKLVKPGGILVYATCSLQAEEGPLAIEKFLSSGAPFERSPVSGEDIGGLSECITEKGELRTLPCHLASAGGMDGFFAARLIRKAD